MGQVRRTRIAIPVVILAGVVAIALLFGLPSGTPEDPSLPIEGERPAQPKEEGRAPAKEGALKKGAPPSDVHPPSPADGKATVVPPQVRTASLSGHVWDRLGLPVSRATVVAIRLDAVERSIRRLREEAEGYESQAEIVPRIVRDLRRDLREVGEGAPRTVSLGDGSYAFERMEDGSYAVLFHHRDFIPRTEDRIAIREGTPRVLDVQLHTGLLIQGRVVDEQGNPVGRMVVTARPSRRGDLRGLGTLFALAADVLSGGFFLEDPSAESGPDGTFSVRSLEPVSYDLEAREDPDAGTPRFAPTLLEGIPAGSEGTQIVVRVAAVVSGRVVDEQGGVIQGARVRLGLSQGGQGSDAEGLLPGESSAGVDRTDRTSPEGRFHFEGLSPGSYHLSVVSPGRVRFDQDLTLEPGERRILDPVRLGRGLAVGGVVMGGDGIPIYGMRVSVLPDASLIASVPGPQSVVGSTMTGPEGRFRVEGLGRGRYALVFQGSELPRSFLGGVDAGTEDLIIVLHAGPTLRGNVTDRSTGEPIPGARVQADSVEVVTDSEGEFIVLGAGNADLGGLASSPAFSASVTLLVRHPDYETLERSVDLSRAKEETLVLGLRRCRAVLGVIVDEQGAPVPGAQVTVARPGSSPFWNLLDLGSHRHPAVLTGPKGRFAVPGMPTGRTLQATVVHPDYAPAASDVFVIPEDDHSPLPEVRVVMSPGWTLSGVVTDRSRIPIRGARLSLSRILPPDPNFQVFEELGFRPGEATTFSDPSGGFTFHRLAPGRYDIVAEMIGYARNEISGIEVFGDRRDLIVGLDSGGTIWGRVVNQDGKPLPQAEVTAYLEIGSGGGRAREAEMVRESIGGGVRKVRTGEDGSFTIDLLPEGRFSLVARLEGYDQGRIAGVPPGASGQVIVLSPRAVISGSVLRADTGEPVGQYTIVHESLGEGGTPVRDGSRGGVTSFTGADGEFRLAGLSAGRYRLSFIASGFMSYERDVRVEAGAGERLDIRLVPAGSLTGTVTMGDGGSPVARAAVRFVPGEPPGTLDLEVVTGEDGSFRVENLPAGLYRAEVAHQEAVRAIFQEAQVRVRAGELTEVSLEVEQAGQLEGSLLGEAGDPLPGRSLVLQSSGTGLVVREACGRDGSFRVEGLAPGSYRILVERPGAEAVPVGEVTIREGETEGRDFVVDEF